jgi:hypothetical protein
MTRSAKAHSFDLVGKIPPLRIRSFQELDIQDSTDILAKYIMRLQTSMHPKCTEPEKDIPYTMVIALSKCTAYRLTNERNQGASKV